VALSAGTRLGPYTITAPLGAGVMGEVYRAGDTRLGRDVAIKVLPAAPATDAERLQRFEQEARAAAALNHPNLLAVFDIGRERLDETGTDVSFIDVTYVSGIERGRRNPGLNTLNRLAWALKVSLPALVANLRQPRPLEI
jgi:serine/threonine protein kinase